MKQELGSASGARCGTGGGLYRAMYTDFLEDAADIIGNKQLTDAAKSYRALARQWSPLAKAMLPNEIKPFKES